MIVGTGGAGASRGADGGRLEGSITTEGASPPCDCAVAGDSTSAIIRPTARAAASGIATRRSRIAASSARSAT
jgi:hypothetical protein